MAILGAQLDKGDTFPNMSWKMLDGTTLTLPDNLKERWNVIIILRGHW